MTRWALVMLMIGSVAWAQVTLPPPVLATLSVAAAPGTTLYLAVAVEVLEGWAIQAHKPTLPYLIPTVLTPEPAPGLLFGEVVYPAPQRKRMEFARRELEVYTGEVLFLLPVTVAWDAAAGVRRVRVKLQYQACSSTQCLVPEEVELEVQLWVVPVGQASRPRGEATSVVATPT